MDVVHVMLFSRFSTVTGGKVCTRKPPYYTAAQLLSILRGTTTSTQVHNAQLTNFSQILLRFSVVARLFDHLTTHRATATLVTGVLQSSTVADSLLVIRFLLRSAGIRIRLYRRITYIYIYYVYRYVRILKHTRTNAGKYQLFYFTFYFSPSFVRLFICLFRRSIWTRKKEKKKGKSH